ncbi:MAG TPA: hypothetical protein VF487_06670 [Chitinophagaceae bacterium]
MKKKRSTLQGFILCFSLFLIIQSCNDEKTTDKKEAQSAANLTDTAIKESTPLTAGPFAVLKLEKQKLLELFAEGQVKKLLIQFSQDNTPGGNILGIAYGAKPTNVFLTGPKDLVQATSETWDTTGKKILGNNELSESKIKKIIGGPIAQNAQDLYFYPKKNANNHIYYVVSTQLIAFTKMEDITTITYPPTSEDTNPSPPDPPCTTCDLDL